MSPALEDYLETIYLLVQEHGFARVKDIARARDVKAATVSVALRKLAELDLIRYERPDRDGDREVAKVAVVAQRRGRPARIHATSPSRALFRGGSRDAERGSERAGLRHGAQPDG